MVGPGGSQELSSSRAASLGTHGASRCADGGLAEHSSSRRGSSGSSTRARRSRRTSGSSGSRAAVPTHPWIGGQEDRTDRRGDRALPPTPDHRASTSPRTARSCRSCSKRTPSGGPGPMPDVPRNLEMRSDTCAPWLMKALQNTCPPTKKTPPHEATGWVNLVWHRRATSQVNATAQPSAPWCS